VIYLFERFVYPCGAKCADLIFVTNLLLYSYSWKDNPWIAVSSAFNDIVFVATSSEATDFKPILTAIELEANFRV